MDKISAVMYRDFVWLWNWKPNLYAQVLTPVAYLLFAVALSGNMKQGGFNDSLNANYLSFFIPGLIILQTFNRFSSALNDSSNDRRWGVFRVYMTTKMKPFHYVIGKAFVSTFICILQSIFILGVGILLSGSYFYIGFGSILILIYSIVASSFFWTFLGIAIGITTSQEEKRTVYSTLLTLPIMFSSSIFYDVSRVPKFIYWLSRFNPLTYMADVARNAFFNNYNLAEVITVGALMIIAFFVAVRRVSTAKLIPDQM